MPSRSGFRLLTALLCLIVTIGATACDDAGQQAEPDADLAVTPDLDAIGPDTGESDTGQSDVPTPDTTGDIAPDTARDTHTTGLDIQFDVDYDGELDAPDDTASPDTLVPDTADTADDDTADTAADTADTGSDWSGPPTPFDDLDHLRGEALRSALLDRIDGHTSLGYDGARSAMYDTTSGIDVDESGQLTCVYTGATVVSDGSNTPGGTFNTEHSWPQSQGASSEPARSDLHHLFPATQTSNSVRGSIPYGDTACNQSASCTWYQGGSELGASVINGTSVFEVRPERRGDIARAQFYFAVRYALAIAPATEIALRTWHDDDPPDDLERARLDAIEALQANRNPFIDRPDFVDYIGDF